MRRLPWKSILIGLGVVIVSVAAWLFWPERVELSALASAGEGYDVTILRDEYGVPHIFGVTDGDAAYGLAFAHAEDDFLTIQQGLIAARGLLGSVYGPDAAPNDYMVQLLRIWDNVDAHYDTDLTPATKAVMEGYAAGINHYAALHPDQVLTAAVFPVTGKDIVAGSVHKSPLFFGLDGTLGDLFKDTRQSEVAVKGQGSGTGAWGLGLSDSMFAETRYGSNTFAIGPSRTDDGSTVLAINSHQPWTGPVAWYEAHVHSEEGWDATGGLFPGSPVIILGHNRDLGWSFTVNHPDLVDVFVLDINPDNPNQYRFDGQWLDLEVGEAPLDVKLFRRLHWTVKRELLWSVYGPTVRTDHGVYAIRYPGMDQVHLWQELYAMNKATNYAEWRAAASTQGLVSFNVGYADKAGNIFYLYNAKLPMRAEGYDWSLYLPGNTSDTLWTDYLPFDDLPQVFNPPSGFVQNANSTPFQTTIGEGNPDPARYSETFGIDMGMSNRALRMRELFGADNSITWDEVLAYKFDLAYSVDSDVAHYVRQLLDAPLPADPILRHGLTLLATWDLTTSQENRAAALGVLTLYGLDEKVKKFNGSEMVGTEVETEVLMESFAEAATFLMAHHGRLDVPWGEVNRMHRGEVDLALSGAPDVLHAVYGDLDKEAGVIVGTAGDCYVGMVRWLPDGTVDGYSLHQFGSATLDESSPHYADQAPLFAARQLKPAWMDEAEIRAHLERAYRPGE